MIKMIQRNYYFPGLIIGFYILLNILIWKHLTDQIAIDKTETLNAAKQQNRNLVASLEQYTIRILKDADAALQLVRKEHKEHGINFNMHELLDNGVADYSFVHGMALADSNGNVYNVYPDTLPSSFNVRDREAFIYQKNSVGDSLFISKPVVSRTIKKPVMLLSRKLVTTSGRFNGVVILQIEPKEFTAFYANANMERNELLSLISPDGIAYSRRRGQFQTSGDDIRKGKLLSALKKSPVGDYFAAEILTGIPTFFSYRKMKNYPIIVTAGRTEKNILNDFYDRRKNIYIFGIAFSILLMLLLVFLFFFLQQRKKFERDLTRQILQAQEKERETIGHELHDNINQILTASKLYLELSNEHQKDENVTTSIGYIQTAINEIRNISRDLSAPTLGPKSLIEAISSLISSLETITPIKFKFDYSDYHHELNKEIGLAIYRIIQEQINNTIKHAEATLVKITLGQNERTTYLLISDNGKGFDTREKRNGIGLNNILSRTQVFNGKMLINSSPGKGTRLEVVLPNSNSNHAAIY